MFVLPGTSTILSMHAQAQGEEGREPGTVSGVVFSHPDPAAACEEFKRRGGTVTVEPTVVELPGAKFVRAVIADPDGNEFLIRTVWTSRPPPGPSHPWSCPSPSG